jgi:hypothetical protein
MKEDNRESEQDVDEESLWGNRRKWKQHCELTAYKSRNIHM